MTVATPVLDAPPDDTDNAFVCPDAADLAQVVEDLADIIGELIKVANYQHNLIGILMDVTEVSR